MMPTVSVIIPTYKHRNFVLATLESVFAQTFTDYEVIVINDGSPDDTSEVLRPLADAGRIQYIEQPNAGQAAGRNRGIAAARGAFIALLDDDDLWPPDKLQWQVEALQSHSNAVLAYGFAESFGDEVGQVFPGPDAPQGDVREKLLKGCCAYSPGQVLIRAASLKAIGPLDIEIRHADDWDLYLRLATQGEFIYRHRIALHYRKHETNASKDVWQMYLNTKKVMEKHVGKPSRRNAPQWRTYRHNMVIHLVRESAGIAQKQFDTGQRALGRRTLYQAVRMQPMFARRRLFILAVINSLMQDCASRISRTVAAFLDKSCQTH